jgi:hypothetical protein
MPRFYVGSAHHREKKNPEADDFSIFVVSDEGGVGKIAIVVPFLIMKKTQSTRPIWSQAKIVLVSAGAAVAVLAASLLVQWLIYDDWLHRTGPLRIVGTCIATAVTFVFVLRWQWAIRERQLEMVRRMEMILQMNDRIRNALQAIECLTSVAQPEATESVRHSVNVIDRVLREVLAESGHPHEVGQDTSATGRGIKSKSA